MVKTTLEKSTSVRHVAGLRSQTYVDTVVQSLIIKYQKNNIKGIVIFKYY